MTYRRGKLTTSHLQNPVNELCHSFLMEPEWRGVDMIPCEL
jgi:hypothetical protein